MVVYHVPGSVLINFYALFYFILNIALGYRYSRYKHHHSAKEETEVGSGITQASSRGQSQGWDPGLLALKPALCHVLHGY